MLHRTDTTLFGELAPPTKSDARPFNMKGMRVLIIEQKEVKPLDIKDLEGKWDNYGNPSKEEIEEQKNAEKRKS